MRPGLQSSPIGILAGRMAGLAVRVAVVVIDGFVAAEDEMSDVGEDGGAAGRDAPGGGESIQGDQGMVDLLSELEMLAFVEELSGKVDGVARLRGGVAVTEQRTG